MFNAIASKLSVFSDIKAEIDKGMNKIPKDRFIELVDSDPTLQALGAEIYRNLSQNLQDNTTPEGIGNALFFNKKKIKKMVKNYKK